MEYKDIIKVIFKAENEDYIPDGLAYSEMMCERKNGMTLDTFFLYSILETRDKGVGPLAKIVIDLHSERVIDYFEFDDYYEFSLFNNNDEKCVINALDEYEMLYPTFRDYFINDRIDENGEGIVRKIEKTISIFANEDMLKIYKTIAPDMFRFIEEHSRY